MPDSLLTTTEAAQKLGVSIRRVEQLIQNGELPATRYGPARRGTWLIAAADVESYVKKPVGNPNWRKSKPP